MDLRSSTAIYSDDELVILLWYWIAMVLVVRLRCSALNMAFVSCA
jgi:hypothetical protein